MRPVLLAVLVLLAMAAAPAAPIAAQGCEDCEIIKKGVPEVTSAAAPTTSPLSAAALAPIGPVVRAVLYWAEGCGHCHEVLDGVLPQMQQQYGAQLEVRLVEVVSMEDISAFFAVAEQYGFARGRAAVPFLLIGDRALMGVEQITAELPALIETHLAAGGADWPVVGPAGGPAGEPTVGPAGAPGDPQQPASAAADGCDFTLPCPDEEAAAPGIPATETKLPGSAIAPVLAAIGLVAVTGWGLAVFLRRRAGHRALVATPPADTSMPIHGDHDAKT